MLSGNSDNASAKPRLHTTRSFPRMDSPGTTPFIRSRAKTVQSVAEVVDADALPLSLSGNEEEEDSPDVFEKPGASGTSVDDEPNGEEASVLSRNVTNQPDELPIELISLTDRFVNSLGARVHSSPPTIDRISNLFQDFYLRAESHIATHISALASRINRDPSPLSNSKDADSSSRQMLTAFEVTEKRTARKMLAAKQVDMEEAVERRACESVYDKIWRHKSTLDEVRDEKLRSKTAALLLVGINLKDLGIDIDISAIDEKNQAAANECFSTARDYLAKMNEEKNPLGKLRHLAACHKAIVDALTKLLPSSSSADEILPALIYTLVTCPPEGINVISNLVFIQRFRSSSKVDGETAYCLTNLEAAISFLENVDLSELRADAVPEGQTKAADSDSAPLAENVPPLQPAPEKTTACVSSVTASAEPLTTTGTEPSDTLPGPVPPQQGRLNTLFQPPAKVLGAANDAVRNTADQGMKNISATLDSSFNFLFGRLKELQSNQLPGKDGAAGPVLPKTLAEARRLVTSPAAAGNPQINKHDGPSKEPSTPEPSRLRRIGSKAEDTFNGLVAGQHTPRDRSTDSVRTQASSRTSIAASSLSKEERGPNANSALSTPTLESVRSFGNTLNPLNHIPGMIRGFGRANTETSSVPTLPSRSRAPTFTSTTDTKVDPPIQRFLQAQSANDLTIGDVTLLLEDYKRLAAALKDDSTSK
ncbi:VPS9 domain-containing protein [Aspergillus stella-maris]|uniref:VPS9 domain-containing protein n=1 Tax=Aspergillus stella-maris TaxID=1810926 RepID=UPI003CCD60C1